MKDEKTVREIVDGRDDGLVKADGFAAVSTGKMGMTMVGFAVMGQFKMPNTAAEIGIVDNFVLQQKQQSSVHRGFVN